MASASAVASAAPYAISYQGTIDDSDFPEIINGQTYTVTFVFDNGGSSANSQTWTGANLTCTIWRMNNARNVIFAQDLVATPPSGSLSGSLTTDASGALTAIFSAVTTQTTGSGGVPAGAYATTGITLTAPVAWYANSGNRVLYDSTGGNGARAFGDAAGGVQMNITNWSAPQPFSGACSALPPPPAAVAPVPTLGEWGLALLGLAAAGLGARRLRRRA
ncbi:MAG: IPTL-CTERM sorting domain-containing protein [Burkholderiaceae bacterium]